METKTASQVASIDDAISDLKHLAAQTKNVAALAEQLEGVSDLDGLRASLQVQADDLTNQVAKLTDQVASLKTEHDAVKEALLAARASVKVEEDRIEAIKAEVAAIKEKAFA